MRTAALLILLACLSSPALAGKNAGGALIVHTIDDVHYTTLICAQWELHDPGTCENANTQTDVGEDTPALIWLIVSFLESSNPGVLVIYFGLNHNLPPGQGHFANFGMCAPAGSLEIPDPGWPDTGGNSVAFSSPVIGDTFFNFYVLNAYGFVGAFVGTGINPTGGYAAFVDDSSPPILDQVTRFGTVRWGEPGDNDCLCCGEPGACCLPDGSCVGVPAPECDALGGSFLGDETECDPNPCPQLEACCFCLGDDHCEALLAVECQAQGGVPMGAGTDCAPDPCECPPEPGACCMLEGTCEFITRSECGALGGLFQGEGVLCEDVDCLGTHGAACCVGEVCWVRTEDECVASGGVFFPDQPTCDPPFECPPVATESRTWGRIKASYR
jgi:hypothetical protein